MKLTNLAVLLVLMVTLGGCTATRGKKGTVEGTTSSARGNGNLSGAGSDTTPATDAADSGADDNASAGSDDLSGRVVYFELDSVEIKPEGLAVIEAWSKYLRDNPSANARLEGHCDERGTREYNVALGERRANSVQEALTARGVGASQIQVSSFGEERPVALGHDDAAWAQNRRVEILQQ